MKKFKRKEVIILGDDSLKNNKKINIHHPWPLSIGGSNDNINRIPVDKEQHEAYHGIFDNLHPSEVIRLIFDLLKHFFKLVFDTKNEPFQSFLIYFDNQMLQLMDRRSPHLAGYEKEEKIKPTSIDFENPRKMEKVKRKMKIWLAIDTEEEWQPPIIFIRALKWFNIDATTPVVQIIIEEIQNLERIRVKNNKGALI